MLFSVVVQETQLSETESTIVAVYNNASATNLWKRMP